MNDRTVLIVEDNELNMKLVRNLLQIGGYRVLEAESGEKGIELARSHNPHLVLMDIQLPGIDGFEATRIIKKAPNATPIPVIALTSYAMRGDEEKAREAGCDGYISKPINTRSFLKTLETYWTPAPENQTLPVAKPDQRHKSRILIVDDEPLNIKLVRGMLGEGDYEIIEAVDGLQAVELAVAAAPDLILMDIMLPFLDGFEATRRIKEDPRTARIPLIQITALDSPEDKIKGLESGADEFLNRPVNVHELIARVRSLLRLKQYQDQMTTRQQSREFAPGQSETQGPEEARQPRPVILLVEDDEKDAFIIRSQLEGVPYRVEWEREGPAALERVRREKIDLLLLDVLLPGLDGFEVCRRLKETSQFRDIQVVLITCLQDLESKIQGVELGADDYLMKPVNGRELLARINMLLKKKEYLDQLNLRCEQALNSAINDGLTGLFNQAYFKRYLELEIKRALRQQYPLALILIDVDDFKKFNDSRGHLEGDRLLQELARVIRKSIRDIDLAARYGGDEFALVLPYSDPTGALQIAHRIQETLAAHSGIKEGFVLPEKITVSMGLAFYPGDASTMEELIRCADQALYRAKARGKKHLQVFDWQEAGMEAKFRAGEWI
jgi:two-component system cell cycle response regulator